MPKVALELVDSVGFLMASVYRVPGMGNLVLARIAHMSDVIVITEILVASRGDGDVGEGFEASQRLEYRLEGETPLLEELEKWSRMYESSWKRTGCSSFSVSAMTRFRT